MQFVSHSVFAKVAFWYTVISLPGKLCLHLYTRWVHSYVIWKVEIPFALFSSNWTKFGPRMSQKKVETPWPTKRPSGVSLIRRDPPGCPRGMRRGGAVIVLAPRLHLLWFVGIISRGEQWFGFWILAFIRIPPRSGVLEIRATSKAGTEKRTKLFKYFPRLKHNFKCVPFWTGFAFANLVLTLPTSFRELMPTYTRITSLNLTFAKTKPNQIFLQTFIFEKQKLQN